MPVALPSPPAHYEAQVRRPGLAFLAATPRPTKIQWDKHRYWQKIHSYLYSQHKGVCVYCASWTPKPRKGGVDHTSIDHYVPKSARPPLAYEWKNFRMVRSKLNSRKDNFQDVIDPCALRPGWFRLNFTSFFLEPDPGLPHAARQRVTATIQRLRLNDDPDYVNERARVVYRYAAGDISFPDVQRLYPFIASEMQARDFDAAIKPSVVAALARRPRLGA